MNLQVRQASEADWAGIQDVVVEAFGSGHGAEIAELIANLLIDETATPLLSLVATDGDAIAGHVLFTNVEIGNSRRKAIASILAPLAVRPEYQRQGIGGHLISEGINQLRDAGIELVFVLGHPEYYPKHGFFPAGSRGYDAPYPIPDEHADAWMVQELRSGVIDTTRGQVLCAKALDDPKYWRE